MVVCPYSKLPSTSYVIQRKSATLSLQTFLSSGRLRIFLPECFLGPETPNQVDTTCLYIDICGVLECGGLYSVSLVVSLALTHSKGARHNYFLASGPKVSAPTP